MQEGCMLALGLERLCALGCHWHRMWFGSFVRIGRHIVEVLREHFQLIKKPLRQKKVKDAWL
jgi:hypothetical protein